MPTIVPRAWGSQCGAPSPTKAGTKDRPPVSETSRASCSVSAAWRMIRRPSRNHWTAAPAMNTLPSSAYTGSPRAPQASVVSSPCFDMGRSVPVFKSRNAPVPYVFFACPGSTQPWPKRAACWSPAMPATGSSVPRCSGSHTPNDPFELRTSGRASRRTPKSRSRSSSHDRAAML